MIQPSLSHFRQMATQGNFVPVFKEFLSDLETPVSAYLKIKNKSFSYLLESADGGKQWGRYSFIGYQPLLIAAYRDQTMEVRTGTGDTLVTHGADLLAMVRDIIRQFKPVPVSTLPVFQGGLVGYINYDLVRTWERLPLECPEDLEMPEAVFIVPERLIIFDHLTHHIKVIAFAYIEPDKKVETLYERACKEIEDTLSELNRPVSLAPSPARAAVENLQANFSQIEFENAVRRAKEYILAGDITQVVLSQKFFGEVRGDCFSLYRTMRSINPSPYMFYLHFGETILVGASPESLVRLTNGVIELRPIAGTRPRGEDWEKDRALEKELLADPKECAEHVMLLDLGRNDAGKVAVAGSVAVPRFMEVERYSHVMHIVSTVKAQLRPDADQFDLFRAVFPAGTVSGSPKIRAMEIINELEPSLRGPYAGAVGYFGFNGNVDFCITIRSMWVVRNRLSFQVGAGIVADSVPEREFQETLNKAGAMLQAIQKAHIP
jgi:anthranilate synthase component 1